MVCAGFSVLLVELLKSVDIEATAISIKVDVSYDDGFIVEEKPGQLEGHRRVFVHLNDSKYGIDGYYNADPTRDNNMEKSLYVHSSMTIEETS